MVFVVDDDLVNCIVLMNYLVVDGYKVFVVSSGGEVFDCMV